MALCGVVAFFMCGLPFYADAARYPDTVLSSPYLPVILSMLAGYIVSECFFNVRALPRPPRLRWSHPCSAGPCLVCLQRGLVCLQRGPMSGVLGASVQGWRQEVVNARRALPA
jgi:hypothetical protein